jgi:hypothetical protein
VKRTPPTEVQDFSGLKVARLIVLITQTRGILRPAAHRELREVISTARSNEEIGRLLQWGEEVLEADFRERYSLARPRTKLAVRDCPLPIFSQPHKAFQVRWMHRPQNVRALLKHLLDVLTMRTKLPRRRR